MAMVYEPLYHAQKYGKCTRDFGAFLFLLVSTFLYFGGVFKAGVNLNRSEI